MGCAASKQVDPTQPDPGPNPRPKTEAGAGTRDTETPAPRPPHFGPEALLASVESGAIAPLRGRWLVDLEARGGRVQRRQDLPPGAFFPADELRRQVEALGDDYGLLFAGLSYRWLSKDNPDPDGFHLKIVAAVARVYMHEDGDRSPLTKAFAAKGLGAPDFALFWDFASLFQQPREEPKQVELFKEGLKASNVWYGHESTVCWMQTELPPDIRFDAHIAQTYDESGWCFVEAAISAGLKVGKRRLDLAKRTDKAMEFAYGGAYGPQEAMLEGVCAAARLPPLLPDEVRRRLDEKKFTSKADVDVVDGLYRAFFDGAADSATQLNFSGLGWAEAEARQLKEVLPRFTRLKALDLSDNALGAAGASAIVSLLKTMQISSLKCAAQPRTLPQWLPVLSAPIDTHNMPLPLAVSTVTCFRSTSSRARSRPRRSTSRARCSASPSPSSSRAASRRTACSRS